VKCIIVTTRHRHLHRQRWFLALVRLAERFVGVSRANSEMLRGENSLVAFAPTTVVFSTIVTAIISSVVIPAIVIVARIIITHVLAFIV
jgi:hypothetical protein